MQPRTSSPLPQRHNGGEGGGAALFPDFTLEPKEFMGTRFKELKSLGRGSFGEAVLVMDHISRKHMVVKRLTPDPKRGQINLQNALTEFRNIQKVQHVNIVKCHMAWVEASNGQLHMLFEYCDGGDLELFLSKAFPIPESIIIQMLAQLLIGLDHLHTKHIIHRDIKLANILLSHNPLCLKIADFGLAKLMPDTDTPSSTCLGTPMYFSPELAMQKEYNRKTDIWSLGVLGYYLLTNQSPFPGRTYQEIMARITQHHPTSPTAIAPQYDPELGRLVMRMLSKSRSARPTARECLASPIFRAPLRHWPWKPEWYGCRCMFVNRADCCVNIRAEPNMNCDILHMLSYGDQILVRGEVVQSTEGGATGAASRMVWYHLAYPVDNAFCISEQSGKALFQGIDDATRASPFPHVRASSPITAGRAAAGAATPQQASSPTLLPGVATPQQQNRSPVQVLMHRTPSPLARNVREAPALLKPTCPSPRPSSPLLHGGTPAAAAMPLQQPTSPIRRPFSPLRVPKPTTPTGQPLPRVVLPQGNVAPIQRLSPLRHAPLHQPQQPSPRPQPPMGASPLRQPSPLTRIRTRGSG